MTADEQHEERIAICVESGIGERRAVAIADCEERVRSGASRWCACGAGHDLSAEESRA